MTGPAFADYPRTLVLKDGAHVVLRPMLEADRSDVAMLLAPVPLRERALVEEAEIVILACETERVAGALALARRGDAGQVAIVLDAAYRARRLGTWMLLDAVHLAAALGLARLEAQPLPADLAYRSALARLDFVEARGPSGEDPGILVKTLHVGWPDF